MEKKNTTICNCCDIQTVQQQNFICELCGCNRLQTNSTEISSQQMLVNETVKRKIVIVGGGIASMTLLRQLVKEKNLSLTLITKEKRLPYYRTSIPRIITNPSLLNYPQFCIECYDFFEKNSIHLFMNSEVQSIDKERKTVHCKSDERMIEIEYDDLVFATGGKPVIPPFIQNSQCEKIVPIHNVEDMERILYYIEHKSVSNIVVIGAGLCGMEIVDSLKKLNPTFSIKIIETANRILPRQLSEEASKVFTSIIESNGIQLYTNAFVESILPAEDDKMIIHLRDGKEIPADIVCFSCGIQSEKSLAQQIGCECKSGIVVNEQMQTSIDHVYSCGDCCEFNNQCYCSWTEAIKQAQICSKSILGIQQHYLHSSKPYYLYCIVGVYSIGRKEGTFIIKQKESNFLQLFFSTTSSKTQLIGAIVIGKIIQKLQKHLVKVIENKIEGEDLEIFINQWNEYFI